MNSKPQGTIFERIVEKFKERERRIGAEQVQREWVPWYERMQAAQREGRPFNELPPGYSSENQGNNSVPSPSTGEG